MLTIKQATFADIELIRTLTLQVWPQTYAPILSKPQIDYMLELMYSSEALQKQMQEKNKFIIAYNAAVPVGFASYSETAPTIFKLHKLYILPSQQGNGTGKFLIDHIITDISAKGAAALRLNVNRYNSAKNFYEKNGFIIIGEEDVDIGNGYFMNDFVMEKKLYK